MNNTFTFTTKETYLTWRAEWKAQYAELSADIRKSKADFKASASVFSRAQNCATRDAPATMVTLREAELDLEKCWKHLQSLKVKANAQLQLLIDAKLEAGRQYNAQKELQNV